MTSFWYHHVVSLFVKALKMLGVSRVDRHYLIDHRRKSVVFLVPVNDGYHVVALHFSHRKWYTPPSIFELHRRALLNAYNYKAKKHFRVPPHKIASSTYVFVSDSYTKTVKGRVIQSYTGVKTAYYVFKFRDYLRRTPQFLHNLYQSRLKKLRESLEKINIKPYGDVKRNLEAFENLCNIFAYFSTKSPPPP